jgi:hypothetical protein
MQPLTFLGLSAVGEQQDTVLLAKKYIVEHPEACKVSHRGTPSKTGEQHEHGSVNCVAAFLGEENWSRSQVGRLLLFSEKLDPSLMQKIAPVGTTHPGRKQVLSQKMAEELTQLEPKLFQVVPLRCVLYPSPIIREAIVIEVFVCVLATLKSTVHSTSKVVEVFRAFQQTHRQQAIHRRSLRDWSLRSQERLHCVDTLQRRAAWQRYGSARLSSYYFSLAHTKYPPAVREGIPKFGFSGMQRPPEWGERGREIASPAADLHTNIIRPRWPSQAKSSCNPIAYGARLSQRCHDRKNNL